jgi:large subunit ribosomal protein L5
MAKKQEIKHQVKESNNVMRMIKIDKLILHVGGIADELEKGAKLLEYLTKRKAAKMKTKKRIPTFNIRPGLEVGAMITMRKGIDEFLRKMLTTIDNKLRKKQINQNGFSFGIKEYIEIPGAEYQREIGIRGFDVTVSFKRAGYRVRLKKIKRGHIPKRQAIKKEEIIKFMEEKFGTKFR